MKELFRDLEGALIVIPNRYATRLAAETDKTRCAEILREAFAPSIGVLTTLIRECSSDAHVRVDR